MNRQPHTNKLGEMPMKQLIISMSLPLMISLLIQSLYNIVDSIFIAMISEDSLTATLYAILSARKHLQKKGIALL